MNAGCKADVLKLLKPYAAPGSEVSFTFAMQDDITPSKAAPEPASIGKDLGALRSSPP